MGILDTFFMSQKIKIIEGMEKDGVESFERKVNEFCAQNNVFATQTHIENDEGCIKFFAICFYRG